jgi:hypothetical protein
VCRRGDQDKPSEIKAELEERMQPIRPRGLSTLRRVIESLGGELEIIAHLPSGDVRLSQFQDAG